MSKNKRKYKNGDILAENEYLLRRSGGVGFLSKLNKDGSVNKNFLKWKAGSTWVPDKFHRHGGSYKPPTQDNLNILIHVEDFASGWKFVGFRGGESQDWAILKHPEGFLLEVHIKTLVDMIGGITIKNGVLKGKYKWSYSKLIKE